MQITLDRLRLDQMAMVTRIDTGQALALRLRDFGLVPGTWVRCRYRSPGGSVTALEFRGSVLALRTADLRRIWGCC